MIEKFFTQNEVDLLTLKKKRVNWTAEEISKALALRILSRRAYVYLREKQNHPLPGAKLVSIL